MNLELNNNKVYISFKDKKLSITDLTKDELLELFDYVYNDKNNFIELYPNFERTINDIKNPIDKEITNQIFKQLYAFAENVENISDEIESKFPEL